jgi:hypothetical protein
MQDVIDSMRSSLRDIACASFKKCLKTERTEWLKHDAAQCILLVSLSQWVESVESGINTNTIGKSLEKSID